AHGTQGRRADAEGGGVPAIPPSGVAALQVLLELLPERLLGGRLAVLDEGADGLTELVERDRADDGLALRGLVAVDPVRDALLVIQVQGEKLLARDAIDLLLLGRRADRAGGDQTADDRAQRDGSDDELLLHDALLDFAGSNSHPTARQPDAGRAFRLRATRAVSGPRSRS